MAFIFNNSVDCVQLSDQIGVTDTGNLTVATPDGENVNEVVNVQYVNNVVGTIEDALKEINSD